MKVVKLSFNPDKFLSDNDGSDWLRKIFLDRGIALKFWALYKQNHLADESFNRVCVKLSDIIKEMLNPKNEEEVAYENPYDFINLLCRCGFKPIEKDFHRWLLKNWDYFNLNTRRGICLEYTIVKQFGIIN